MASRFQRCLRSICAVVCLALSSLAAASENHGQVTFGALPLPGATVTLTQGEKKFVTVTDQQGVYSFSDLADGPATIEVEMQCFSTIKQELIIEPNAQAGAWELQLLPLDQIKAETVPGPPASAVTPA